MMRGLMDPMYHRHWWPNFGHFLRDTLQALARIGAAFLRCGRGIHMPPSSWVVGSCWAPIHLARVHGGRGRCSCSQVGRLAEGSSVRSAMLGDPEESSMLVWAWHENVMRVPMRWIPAWSSTSWLDVPVAEARSSAFELRQRRPTSLSPSYPS
jgi:hypothetical protein